MQLFVRDKSFYKKLALIAIPIACQNLITFGVSMADTVMIGLLSEVHLSAVALANQIGFVFMLFTFGLGSGCNVMISQYWGKRDIPAIHRIITMMYRFLLAGAIPFTLLAICFPRQAMSVFSTDPAVIAEGAKFLRIIGFSYLVAGFNSVTVIMLRSVGAVKVSLVMSISSLVVNVSLNWVLIFGKLGAPAMGVVGAAIATCIARLVEMVIVLFYLIKMEKQVRYNFRSLFVRRMGILRPFTATAVPVIINEIVWSLGMSMISIIIGRMGTAFTAANSVCSVLSQLVTIFIFGVGNASAVIMGNTVGEGRYDTAKAYARTIMALSVLLGLMSSVVVLLLRDPMVAIYNITDEARLYATQIINVYAVVVILISLSANAMLGVLRGGGDTRFVLLLDIVFMWAICIPLGFLAGLKFAWPVPVVYAIIKCDELFKVAFAMGRIRGGKWINDVTRMKA